MVLTTTPHNAKLFPFMDCQFNFFFFVAWCMVYLQYDYFWLSKKKKKTTNFRFQLWLLSSRQKWLNLMTYKQEFWIQWLLRPGKWGTFWIRIFLFSIGKLDYRKWNVILWPNSRRWLFCTWKSVISYVVFPPYVTLTVTGSIYAQQIER